MTNQNSLDILNDKNSIKKMMELFSHIQTKYNFNTPIGKEFKEVINAAIEEHVKPFAMQKYNELKAIEKNG